MSQKAVRESHSENQPLPRGIELGSDLYREIFGRSKEAIAIISPEGHYLEQNGAHYLLLGYADDELQGRTPALHLGEGTFQKIAAELAETGEYFGEVICRTKSGEQKTIELTAFSMRSGVGETVCYVGIKRDITARKLADARLRRSESELADFFENAAIGMHWVADDGTILRVNSAELEMLGYSREEYVGHNISSFHLDKHVISEMLSRLRAGEVLRDYEARLRCKDGSVRYVRINSSVYSEGGQFIHTRCFTNDITDRRRTEQRLALQYAITRILSCSIDFVEGTHEILSTVCESLGWQLGALWAVDYQNEVLRCVDVWHDASLSVDGFDSVSRQRTFKMNEGLPGRIWQTGKPAWIRNVTSDPNFPRGEEAKQAGLKGAFGFPILLGREIIGVIEFFSQEIRQPDDALIEMIGGIGGQIGLFQERMRAEEKLAQLLVRERAARADSEKANRLKDEFLATLSHELRTPLNAVIGWSRILKSGRLDGESSQHALDVVERNAWAQKQIIEDILDVSRVITGKLQLHTGPVDLVSVTNTALDAVRPALEAKDIAVKTDYQRTQIICGDADRLQQVIWNLLANASKFTPQGGVVTVQVREEGGYAQIQVKDTGPGVSPDFLPHVFERFRQEDGSTTRTHGGLGLGLAIVRHLVELHGGVIGVENGADSGAIFTVKLPLPSSDLRLEPKPAIVAHKDEVTTNRVDLKDLRILVVEDESDALDLITMELAEHGARVKGAESANEAFAILDSENFDLLISDIGMADTDGYSLIRQLRARKDQPSSDIPAIALTAYARAQDRARAIAAGYNTHLAKPVETRELVTIVKCLTGRIDEGGDGG